MLIASNGMSLHLLLTTIKQGAVDLLAGGVRGAGSIGATLLYPIDRGLDLYYGDRNAGVSSLVTGKKPLSRNEERRQQMDEALPFFWFAHVQGRQAGWRVAGTAGAPVESWQILARETIPAASPAGNTLGGKPLALFETSGRNCGCY